MANPLNNQVSYRNPTALQRLGGLNNPLSVQPSQRSSVEALKCLSVPALRQAQAFQCSVVVDQVEERKAGLGPNAFGDEINSRAPQLFPNVCDELRRAIYNFSEPFLVVRGGFTYTKCISPCDFAYSYRRTVRFLDITKIYEGGVQRVYSLDDRGLIKLNCTGSGGFDRIWKCTDILLPVKLYHNQQDFAADYFELLL